MHRATRNARKFVLPIFLVLTIGMNLVALADTDVLISSAVSIRYSTQAGKFYQVQVKNGDHWDNVGVAVEGTGEPVESVS